MAHNTDARQIQPSDLIFSCAICSKLLKTHQDELANDANHVATGYMQPIKMWFTSCAHIICSLHFDGGGVPFHKKGQRPQASCPFCVSQNKDDKEKDLFWIRGNRTGEYDTAIPKNWFTFPAISFDSDNPDAVAMRFQIFGLTRTALNNHKNLVAKTKEVEDLQDKLSSYKKRIQEFGQRITEMKKENSVLQKLKEEHDDWKRVKSEVTHYLSQFKDLGEENQKLREALASFGYHVPAKKYLYTAQRNDSAVDETIINTNKGTNELPDSLKALVDTTMTPANRKRKRSSPKLSPSNGKRYDKLQPVLQQPTNPFKIPRLQAQSQSDLDDVSTSMNRPHDQINTLHRHDPQAFTDPGVSNQVFKHPPQISPQRIAPYISDPSFVRHNMTPHSQYTQLYSQNPHPQVTQPYGSSIEHSRYFGSPVIVENPTINPPYRAVTRMTNPAPFPSSPFINHHQTTHHYPPPQWQSDNNVYYHQQPGSVYQDDNGYFRRTDHHTSPPHPSTSYITSSTPQGNRISLPPPTFTNHRSSTQQYQTKPSDEYKSTRGIKSSRSSINYHRGANRRR